MRQSNCDGCTCKFWRHFYQDNGKKSTRWRHQPSGWTPHQCTNYLPLDHLLRLHHRDWFVVNLNKDSSIVVVVNLSVDVVPSWGRNCQFSVLVRHTACKIAVRSTDRPILDHYETNYQHISVKLWKVWTHESFQSVCNVTTQLIYKVIPLTINPPS